MPFQPPPRWTLVLASAMAVAGIVLIATGCANVAPIGPDSAPTPARHIVGTKMVVLPPVAKLAAPIVLQIMRSQPATASGRCPVGWIAVYRQGTAALLCYRPVGTPVTITSASISAVQPNGPPGSTRYGFTVMVAPGYVRAVTTLVAATYHAGESTGITVAGKLWEAPRPVVAFPGNLFQIALPSRGLALQLHQILVPDS
jgi:hypothetical protein